MLVKAEIGSVQRNHPHDNVPPGACRDIINMRWDKNSWQRIPPKKQVLTTEFPYQTVNATTKLWRTERDGYPIVFKYDSTGQIISLFKYNGSTWDSRTLSDPLSTNKYFGTIDMDIQFLENIVVIFDNTNKEIHYALLTNEVIGSPKIANYIGTMQLPEIEFSLSVQNDAAATNIDMIIEDWETEMAVITNQAAEAGKFEGWVSIICAYRLFDGTFVYHSNAQALWVGNRVGVGNLQNAPGDTTIHFENTSTGTIKKLKNYQFGFPKFTCEMSAGSIQTVQYNYKNIIRDICVFMTRPRPCINQISVTWDGSTILLPKTTDVFTNPMLVYLDTNYYMVDSFPADQLSTVVAKKLNIGNLNYLNLNVPLPVDQFSRLTNFGEQKMIYNSRLNLGDVTVNAPADIPHYIDESFLGISAQSYWFYAEIEISAANGPVYFNTTKSDKGVNNSTIIEVPILQMTYPDNRITAIRYLAEHKSTHTVYLMSDGSYVKRISKNPLHNFSFIELTSGQVTQVYTYAGLSIYTKVYLDTGSLTAYTPKTIDSYSEQGMVKISEVINPFVFLAKNAYKVGESKIMGIATNAVRVADGQYGQFPIIVLTKDGNWSMEIGTGDIYITRITPHSYTLCVNAKSVSRVESMTFFIGQEGICALSADTSECITRGLLSWEDNPLIDDTNYDVFTRAATLIGFANYDILEDSFEDFFGPASNLIVGYNPIKREIMFSNYDYSFSWVLSLTYKKWYKISETFVQFISSFSRWFGIRKSDYAVVDLSVETTGSAMCVIQTAPISIDTREFKRMRRAYLRASLKVNTGKKAGFYVYNRENNAYVLVAGNQRVNQTAPKFINDFPVPIVSTSQEFIFLFCAEMTEGSVTGIDMDVEPIMANKIR